jgi:hypothetical protein
MITQERLKELFSYDPATGHFVNLVDCGARRAGRIAGSKHNAGYIKLFVDGESHLAHRMAYLYMTGELPVEHMDHINHIRDDNRWENLQMVGRRKNNLNKRAQSRSRSGIPGVAWKERDRRWYANAYEGGRYVYLGAFTDLLNAACARKSAELRFGYHENNGKH